MYFLQGQNLDLFNIQNQWLFVASDTEEPVTLPLRQIPDGSNIAIIQRDETHAQNDDPCKVSNQCFEG